MTSPAIPMDKSELRRKYRSARKAVDARERVRLDREIRGHIRNALPFGESVRFGAYWAMDGEPDLRPLLDRASKGGKIIALPVLGEGRRMKFCEWRPGAPLKTNRFAIPEPAEGDVLPLETLDMVLVPLVAWDRSGHRLGMGGGYYDNLFRACRAATRPMRVGVAYAAQEAAALPADAWDVSLHAVVTERGWFTCPS